VYFLLVAKKKHRTNNQEFLSALLRMKPNGDHTGAVFRMPRLVKGTLGFTNLCTVANLVFLSIASAFVDREGTGDHNSDTEFLQFYIVDFTFLAVALVETILRSIRSFLLTRGAYRRRSAPRVAEENRMTLFLFLCEFLDFAMIVLNFAFVLIHTQGLSSVLQPKRDRFGVALATGTVSAIRQAIYYLRILRYLRLLRFIPYSIKYELLSTLKGLKVIAAVLTMLLYVVIASCTLVDSFRVDSTALLATCMDLIWRTILSSQLSDHVVSGSVPIGLDFSLASIAASQSLVVKESTLLAPGNSSAWSTALDGINGARGVTWTLDAVAAASTLERVGTSFVVTFPFGVLAALSCQLSPFISGSAANASSSSGEGSSSPLSGSTSSASLPAFQSATSAPSSMAFSSNGGSG
jgi:hypothetical protein